MAKYIQPPNQYLMSALVQARANKSTRRQNIAQSIAQAVNTLAEQKANKVRQQTVSLLQQQANDFKKAQFVSDIRKDFDILPPGSEDGQEVPQEFVEAKIFQPGVRLRRKEKPTEMIDLTPDEQEKFSIDKSEISINEYRERNKKIASENREKRLSRYTKMTRDAGFKSLNDKVQAFIKEPYLLTTGTETEQKNRKEIIKSWYNAMKEKGYTIKQYEDTMKDVIPVENKGFFKTAWESIKSMLPDSVEVKEPEEKKAIKKKPVEKKKQGNEDPMGLEL